LVSKELRSLRTHSTAKSDGEGKPPDEELRKVWSAEKWSTTIFGKVYVDAGIKDAYWVG
jgi:hypothetical protein